MTLDIHTCRRLLVAAVLSVLATAVRPSTYQRFFDTESLSSNLVSSISQDSRGYIWIATAYGLNCFDGVHFTQYYDDTGEGLAKNSIQYLLPVGDEVYVAGFQFVQVYSPDDNRFHSISFEGSPTLSVKGLARGVDGAVWVLNSGQGLWRIDRDKMTARPIEAVNSRIGRSVANNMVIDSRGRIWIGTLNDGLLMYDTHSGKTGHYFAGTHAASGVSGIMEGADGMITVATNSDGVYIYDGRSDTMRFLCGAPGLVMMRGFSSRGGMYVGTDKGGVWRVDAAAGAMRPVFQEPGGMAVPKTNVWAFCEDKDGNAWIGFSRSGVMFVSQRQESFSYIGMASVSGDNGRNILGVTALANGNLMLGQEGNGLFEVTQGGVVRGRWLEGVGINCALQIDGSRLMVGSQFNHGVGILDMHTGKVDWADAPGLGSGIVKSIVRDRRGNYYIGIFSRGLYSLEPDGKTLRTLGKGRLGICNKYVNILQYDSRGLLWIGHYYGFDVYDPVKDRIVSLPVDSLIRPAVTFAITESPGGIMWFGTNRGLFSYDYARRSWKRYTKADGLPSNMVSGVVSDGAGSLWVSTNRGLCRLDLKTGRMAAFYKGNGIKDNNYLRAAYGLSPYGLVYFGNERGVTFFIPKNVRMDSFQKGITMTGVYLGGRKVVMRDDAVRLDYLDNTFTLCFSTMDFRETDNIYYEYRFADEPRGVWHQTPPGVSEITLTHLSPGSHELLVRVCDGDVTSAVKSIDIRITPPWWRSWWAYMLYAAVAVAVIVLAFVAYKRKQQAENNESEIRFLIDVGHELRSPLTLIKSPLDMLLRHSHDQQTDRALRSMKRNTDRMLQLVNQILSIRRIEKGQMRLHYAETGMDSFVGDIIHDYDYEAGRRGIKLVFEPFLVCNFTIF